MVQFNLLPDVKLHYIKAERTKRTVVSLCIIIAGAAIGLFVLFFTAVNVVQKQHLGNLNDDIDDYVQQLEAKPELSKILTIQNQLGSLTQLHSQKPVVSRTFTYIQQVTPQKASMESLTINFAEHTIMIEGSADSLATVNIFADTLKFTTFNAESEGQQKSNVSAFSEVVLSDFSVATVTAGDANKAANYSITLKYDPLIFNDASKVTLVVPSKVTTRSETEKPADIFQRQSGETTGGTQ